MIETNLDIFPNNIIRMIEVRIPSAIDTDLRIFKRPLRPEDPNQSVGLYPNTWNPDEDSFEMSPQMKNIPTLQDYRILVQSFVRHADEEEAINTHNVLAQRIRAMLYADTTLQLAFAELIDTSSGKTEKAMRWGPSAQRFMSNEVKGTFLQSSITEFWLQTATQ